MTQSPSFPNKIYQDFNDSILDDINSYSAGFVSICSNFLLIYGISHVKCYNRSVRISMYYMAFWRLVFSITVALANPVIISTPSTRSLFILKNGIALPIVAGHVLLVIFLMSIVMFCNGPTVQYLQVTSLLKATSQKDASPFIFLIPISIAIPTVFLIYFGYVPQFFDVSIPDEIQQKLRIQGPTAFLIVTTHLADLSMNPSRFKKIDVMSQICTLFILIVMTTSIVFSICSYIRIKILMKEKFSQSSSSSKSTRKSQEQLNMMLLIQFIFPVFFIHIPFYVTFILPFWNTSFQFLTDHMLYLSSWCPAANPIILMFVVKSLRDIIKERVLPSKWSEVSSGKNSSAWIVQRRN